MKYKSLTPTHQIHLDGAGNRSLEIQTHQLENCSEVTADPGE